MYRKNLITDAAKVAKIGYYATDEDGSKCTDNGKWNPITNDADCAQLEMICKLDLDWKQDSVRSGGRLEFYSDHDGDKQAARRLASTRAAASLLCKCAVSRYSSRMCEYGTKGCDIKHEYL